MSTDEITRKLGIAVNTLYRWRAKYGGMEASEAKRVKELEDENARLKKIVANLMLENDAMQYVISKNL